MNFIVACDSFKGTMTSEEAGLIIEDSIKNVDRKSLIKRLVISDGGEGMLKSISKYIPGRFIEYEVHDAWFDPIKAPIYLINNEDTVYIEMASVAGYHLKDIHLNPELTTTLGVGELMRKSLDHHVKRIVVGCGGSATNDGGAGMMHALGVNFYDYDNKIFIPTGSTLQNIKSIDLSGLDPRAKAIEWIAMTDVSNPLVGDLGATRVYGPQKGATSEMIETMEKAMIHFAKLMGDAIGRDDSKKKGSGAAGGLSFGLMSLLNAKIKSGISEMMDIIHLEDMIKNYDYLILGEGSLDEQSLQGKTVIGMARRYKGKIKIIAVVGQSLGDKNIYLNEGIDLIIETNPNHLSFDLIKQHAKEDLSRTIMSWIRKIKKEVPHV